MNKEVIHYKNTQYHYGLIAKVLHWSSVFLLLTLIVIASEFEELDSSPEKLSLIMEHVSVGVIFLLIMISRFTWRQINLNPLLSYDIKQWQKLAALSLHRFIYFLIFLQCVVGSLISLSGDELIHFFDVLSMAPIITSPFLNVATQEVHKFISAIIYPVFAIHISAAIYHQIFGVIDNENQP